MPQSRKVPLLSDGSFGTNSEFVEQDVAENKITMMEEREYVRRLRACRPSKKKGVMIMLIGDEPNWSPEHPPFEEFDPGH